MRVLIAGCGDVGGVLAVSLMQRGHDVYGLKRDTSSLPAGVLPVRADLSRAETLSGMPKDLDALVFMPTPSGRDEGAYEQVFIRGWKNLWRALDSAPRRTLLVSSTSVYGESDGGIVTESTPPEPRRFNGRILLEMERLAAACTDNLVVARIAGIYGPGRERLIRLAVSDHPGIQQHPPLFTNRIHRDDAAAALLHLLELDKPENLYLLADDVPAPRYEVVSWLAKAQGKPAPAGLSAGDGDRGKRISNRRLRASGFSLAYPDYRSGYGAVLASPSFGDNR